MLTSRGCMTTWSLLGHCRYSIGYLTNGTQEEEGQNICDQNKNGIVEPLWTMFRSKCNGRIVDTITSGARARDITMICIISFLNSKNHHYKQQDYCLIMCNRVARNRADQKGERKVTAVCRRAENEGKKGMNSSTPRCRGAGAAPRPIF